MPEQRRPPLDQVLRSRVYASLYWKRELFGATAETVVAEAARLRYVGGTYGPFRKPTRFLCLLLKLVHIAPPGEVVFAFLGARRLKYLAVLALFYVRLTAAPRQAYLTLEQHLPDYRRIVVRGADGRFALGHVDELAEALLAGDRALGIPLPLLPARRALAAAGALPPRRSPLGDEPEAAPSRAGKEPEAGLIQGSRHI